MKQFSQDYQRELIEKLNRIVADKGRSEESIRASHNARQETALAQFERANRQLASDYEQNKESVSTELTRRLAEITRESEAELANVIAQHRTESEKIKQQTAGVVDNAERECRAERARAEEGYDSGVRAATGLLQESQAKVSAGRDRTAAVRADVDKVLKVRRCRRTAARIVDLQPVINNEPLNFFQQELASASNVAATFSRQWAARFLGSGWLFVIFVFTWIAFVLFGTVLGLLEWPWAIAGGAVGLGVAAIVYIIIRPIVVRQTLEIYRAFAQHETNAHKALDGVKAWAVAEADRQRMTLRRARDKQASTADHELQKRVAEQRREASSQQRTIDDELTLQRKRIVDSRSQQQQATNSEFDQRFDHLEREFEQQVADLKVEYDRQTENSNAAFGRSQDRLVERWQQGVAEFRAAAEFSIDYCERHFPEWADANWPTEMPAPQASAVVLFGQSLIPLEPPATTSGDADEDNSAAGIVLPALHAFSDRPAIQWEIWGGGQEAASRSMRNVMLRLLTSLPAGKTRFTIIDPVGLGQNFSAFMHLADLDEKIINHRIWTEPSHINQRLTDLTEHMEDIIQTYLRNEYATIEEYNHQAGEVAEPFRILVVANFPSGFSDEAAARLQSIVNSGGRCGVYTLISTDSRAEMPRDFELADLEDRALTLQWTGSEFCWFDPVLRDLPLSLAEPPADEHFTAIVRVAGERARDANRIEVPFKTVAPADDEWWTQDSRKELSVALGRAGASKLQTLQLGKGTSQHVLISGKTGSGKSTLLHALIMNTAMRYSPRDVQFYLIDFKKGVEFKPYAQYRLPHARVIAIESEREFGISVLQRLDAELRERGDLFRDRGVQEIASFRNENPDEPMPRLLLVIDEFQELFVQDDKLAQDASLLLDRLVRQGRAFGIHVLLGSQTLAGAYSLARSTIGQMAIRIALQCSAADSHLILSEDNTAARLLDRPGDAIYNDANGRFEGNHPFQVVWLESSDQEEYLRRLSGMVTERNEEMDPPIVFEGNVPADPTENGALRKALAVNCASGSIPQAWLGSAVEIKDPTAVAFTRQSGSNLVIVGQQPEAALGLLTNAVIGLAATSPAAAADSPRFVIFDGTRPGSTLPTDWQTLQPSLPGECEVVGPAGMADQLSSLHTELQRRMTASDGESSRSVFCTIFNLSGFRDLRRSETDFGFSSDAADTLSPAQQFVEIMREGPVFGMHCLIWCDTFNSLSRWFDRHALRELDQRVLFQMSATDSSNLMDSPLASRLGSHRAILFSEEQGTHEKFRPYAVPAPEWLDEVGMLRKGRAKDVSLG